MSQLIIIESPENDQYTKVLLHMDGANGGTTFTDTNAGGSAHTWTATTATTSTADKQFGTASMLTGGGYIDTPDHADFLLGSGDWTVDFWLNQQSGFLAVRGICGQLDATSTAASASVYMYLDASNQFNYAISNGTIITSTTVTALTITASGWNHIALVKSGTSVQSYLGGVAKGSPTTWSGAVNDGTSKFAIGRVGESGAFTPLAGYIDEFRLSVGIARWTANFIPPTAAYGPG